LLYNVKPLLGCAAKLFAVQIPAENNGLHSLVKFGRPLGGMVDVLSGEAPQDGFGIGRAEP
jgi:hypothetical protein